MNPELPENTEQIDAIVARLRTTPGVRRGLPEFDALRQSGPFRSVNHFFASSFEYFRHLLYYTNLRPSSRVMDYGCGWARMAIPFSVYLEKERGFYCGLDTDLNIIQRNQVAYESFNNVEFHHVDMYSKQYNKTGKGSHVLKKQTFSEPFDLAFLFSVFTHILPDDLDPVIEFLASNLADDGEIFSTWFLLDDATQSSIDAGLSSQKFATPFGKARIETPDIPEAAVAYPREEALAAFRRAGFTYVQPHPGKWSGCVDSWLFQDAIVARR